MSDTYWNSKLASRERIDPERFARLVAGRLTKYTDLAVVQAAYDDWADAHDEYVRAYRDFWAMVNAIVPKEDQRFPAWERYAPECVQEAMRVHTDVFSVTPSMGMSIIGMRRYGRAEYFPLTKWRGYAAKYRSAAKKLRKACEPLVQSLCERF